MVSRTTAPPTASISYEIMDSGRSLNSSCPTTFHETTSLRGGSLSRTTPSTSFVPSGLRRIQVEPFFQSDSTVRPKKYCTVNSLDVRAAQTFCGVLAIYVTYSVLCVVISFLSIRFSFQLLFQFGEG